MVPSRFRQAIVAAASRLNDPGAEQTGPRTSARSRGKTGVQQWQDAGWDYFDTVPEVKFAARFHGQALSRIRLVPEWTTPSGDRIDVEAAVEPAPEGSEGTDGPARPDLPDRDRMPADLAAATFAQMARLERAPDGLPGLLTAFGTIMQISGDAYLVGRMPPEDPVTGERVGTEEWMVYDVAAVTEVTVGGRKRYRIVEAPGAQPVTLSDDDFIARVWRPHPRYPATADANLRAVLEVADELLIWQRRWRAVARSGTSAGVLVYPQSVDGAAARWVDPADDDGDETASAVPEDHLTPLQRDLVEHWTEPVADDGSPSSVAPYMLAVPEEAADPSKIFLLDFARTIDQKAVDREAACLVRLARGLDVPVEILSGLADANHWTAWQIEDETYKAHLEPEAATLARALVSTFLRPMLEAEGFPADLVARVGLRLDPSGLVVRPNRAQDAKDAYDRGVLSGRALREYLGFTEDDQPSDEELARRIVLDRAIGGMSLTRELIDYAFPEWNVDREGTDDTGGGGEAGGPGDGGGPEDGAPAVPATEPARAVTAAAAQSDVGGRLADVDDRLRERVQAAASAAVTGALAVAGAALRRRAQGDPDVAARLRGVRADEVGLVLGAETAGEMGADELIDPDQFTGLADQFRVWVGAARRDARAIVIDAAVAAGVDHDTAADEWAEHGPTDEDVDAGWEMLLGALLGLARARLVERPATPEQGEWDPTTVVPPGPVRDALARTGGVDLFAAGTDGAPGGPAAGPRTLRVLRRLGAAVTEWTWRHGLPARPFEPHARLDGATFERWDDPILANGGSWPAVSFFRPGDHRGCTCSAAPAVVWVQVGNRARVDAA